LGDPQYATLAFEFGCARNGTRGRIKRLASFGRYEVVYARMPGTLAQFAEKADMPEGYNYSYAVQDWNLGSIA
jgi:hypothetical protein